MNILVIDCGSLKLSALTDQLRVCRVQPLVHQMDAPPIASLNSFQGVVVSGSPLMWSQIRETHLHRFAFLQDLDVPVLGICFGHQMIGLLHGGEIYQGVNIKQPNAVHVLREDPLFDSFGVSVDFDQYHQEGVTLPAGFIHLARSKEYEVEAMKHPTKPVYGVQFHPERSGETGQIFFRNFLNICRIHAESA